MDREHHLPPTDRLLPVALRLRPVREFSADYLRSTRRGMWEDRTALSDLSLSDRERVLDVGCGTGELSAVLAEEVPGSVVGLDRDRSLLGHLDVPAVLGDALSLPFPDGAFDLVVCQALLINLPEPERAVREFARVSSDRVAAIEPDNAAVTIDSTVDAEPPLARRARELYLAGVDTDVTLGAGAGDVFERVGLADVRTRRYDHERSVEPPYADDRETLLAGGATPEEVDDLREEWRAMGRATVEQMQAGEYRRREVVPFFVTVGRV